MLMLCLLSLYSFFQLFVGFFRIDTLYVHNIFISCNGEYKERVGEIDEELGQLVQGNR